MNKEELFDELIKGTIESLEYRIKRNLKSIKENEEQIVLYEREVERYPRWIKKLQDTTDDRLKQNEKLKVHIEIMKEMELA